MTAQPGLSNYLLTKILDHVFRGVTYTPPSTIYAKLHIGAGPGAAGTANPSALTTRLAVTFAAASGSIITITTSYPVFTMTATELVTWVTFWDAPTGGNFLASGILTTPQSEQSGYTFILNVGTIDLTNLLAA